MSFPKFSKSQVLLAALRAYLDSRSKRFMADKELMDSAGKCAMFFEVNDKLTILERTNTYSKLQVCKLVDMYGRLLYDYRARSNPRWMQEDVEMIRYIYELYDAIGDRTGAYIDMFGTLCELNRAYNVMLSIGIDVQMRPILSRVEEQHCDWVLHLLQEDYQRYSYHLTITGNGFSSPAA